jgi:hypothetical protein
MRSEYDEITIAVANMWAPKGYKHIDSPDIEINVLSLLDENNEVLFSAPTLSSWNESTDEIVARLKDKLLTAYLMTDNAIMPSKITLQDNYYSIATIQ